MGKTFCMTCRRSIQRRRILCRKRRSKLWQKKLRPPSQLLMLCEKLTNQKSRRKLKSLRKSSFRSTSPRLALGLCRLNINRIEIRQEILSVTGGETWESQDETGRSPPKLTRSPSCPRLYSTLSLTTSKSTEEDEEPLRSPLTGMVANRKRVFESEY